MRRLATVLFFLIACTIPASAETLIGGEFLVNTTTTNDQVNADVAASILGDFVVVWQSADAGEFNIRARLYDGAGTAQGPDFAIASTANDETRPAVGIFANGSFVVAWEEGVSVGTDGVWFRIFDSSGAPVTSAQQLDARVSAQEIRPAIAIADDGSFVIAVESGAEVYFQRYDNAGTTVGSPIQANVFTSSLQGFPHVAFQGDKDFIVAWSSLAQDGDSYGVYSRRFDWTGSGASEIQVNSYTTGSQTFPRIGVQSSDEYIITWSSFGQDGSGDGVYAQAFTSTDTKLGAEFRVNAYTNSSQNNPDICVGVEDEFAITWQSWGQDGDGPGVLAMDFSASRVPIEESYFVNTTTAGYQSGPRVDVGGAHQVVVWSGEGADGDGYGIQAQRYTASPTLPDLAYDGMSYFSELTDASENFECNVVVQNYGADCGSFSVVVRLSEDSTITPADMTLGTIDVPGLDAGDFVNAFLSAPIPPGAPRGVVYFGAVIDPDYAIAELDESNNSGAASFVFNVPEIFSLEDVHGDQGGSLWLEWYSSPLDLIPAGTISEYTVWRTLELDGAPRMLVESVPTLDEVLADRGSGSVADAFEKEPVVRDANATTFWELVGTQPAYMLDGYAMEVPTMFDSTAVNTDPLLVRVIAHSSLAAYPYYISRVEAGLSTDDLAPAAPLNLMGDVRTGPGIDLAWDANAEEDLAGYHVHRGTTEDFVPTEGNRIGTPTSNVFNDASWDWSGTWFYKVAAADVHGNISGYTALVPASVTATELPARVTVMNQNHPNPFNPFTTIEYAVGKPAPVRIVIFDAAGRRVRTLVDEVVPTGEYSVRWDGRDSDGRAVATGIYFGRMTAGDFRKTIKMAMIK